MENWHLVACELVDSQWKWESLISGQSSLLIDVLLRYRANWGQDASEWRPVSHCSNQCGQGGPFSCLSLQGLMRWNLSSVSVANFLGQSKWKAKAIIQESEVNVCFSDPNTWKTTSTILFDLAMMICTHLSAYISESLFWMSSLRVSVLVGEG